MVQPDTMQTRCSSEMRYERMTVFEFYYTIILVDYFGVAVARNDHTETVLWMVVGKWYLVSAKEREEGETATNTAAVYLGVPLFFGDHECDSLCGQRWSGVAPHRGHSSVEMSAPPAHVGVG